jgi:hypothetical protein
MIRRNLRVGVGAVVIVLIVIWATGPGRPTATASEAHMAAVLAANVTDAYATDEWYPAIQESAGLLNIQVDANTAYVFTNIADTEVGQAKATTICSAVAAVINDPSTGRKLRLYHLKVYGGPAGHDQLASCDEP